MSRKDKFTPKREAEERRKRGRPKGSGTLWTDALRAEILRQLIEGATTRSICAQPGMPSRSELHAELQRNEQFALAYGDAKSAAPAAILDIAMDYATDASGGDPDDMRMAESYMRVANVYAEKIAPKRYGQLLKVGAAEELGPLSVEIVSYSKIKQETKDGE